MSETAVPVAEAAKYFLGVLDWVERQHEPAILVPEGRPVAIPKSRALWTPLRQVWLVSPEKEVNQAMVEPHVIYPMSIA